MLGWHITVEGPGTSEPLATWHAGLGGLAWIDDLVEA